MKEVFCFLIFVRRWKAGEFFTMVQLGVNILYYCIYQTIVQLYLLTSCSDFFSFFLTYLGLVLIYLYSIHRVICRPSDHSVGRSRDEIRTWDGRILWQGHWLLDPHTSHYIPPHLPIDHHTSLFLQVAYDLMNLKSFKVLSFLSTLLNKYFYF